MRCGPLFACYGTCLQKGTAGCHVLVAAGGRLSVESSSCELAVSPAPSPPADAPADQAQPAQQLPAATHAVAAGATARSVPSGVCGNMPNSSSRCMPPVIPVSMSWRERLRATAGLWRYMVPLFVVYFAEYAMQSGTWTAIGEATCAVLGRRGRCSIGHVQVPRCGAAVTSGVQVCLVVCTIAMGWCNIVRLTATSDMGVGLIT